jgi:hypothetical protein
MTPKKRLREAVEAMRNVTNMVAAKWEKTYPDFVKTINNSPFLKSDMDKWNSRVGAMETELQLRIAEVLCE